MLSEARRIAQSYQVVLERDPDMGYMGRTLEMPLAMGDGRTVQACVTSVIEATTVAIAVMLERSERPPLPATSGARAQQVNIRLSSFEKANIEAAAASQGFRSISDYIRFMALGRAG